MIFAILIALVAFAILALPILRTFHDTGALPGTLGTVVEALRPVRVMALLAIVVLLAILATEPGSVPLVPLVAIALVALYLRAWVRAFLYLMGLSDDHFPGRFDKPIWAAGLIALGPLGLWVFHRHRAVAWPEPAVEGTTAAPRKPTTAHDWF
jgi:hypothetical protein